MLPQQFQFSMWLNCPKTDLHHRLLLLRAASSFSFTLPLAAIAAATAPAPASEEVLPWAFSVRPALTPATNAASEADPPAVFDCNATCLSNFSSARGTFQCYSTCHQTCRLRHIPLVAASCCRSVAFTATNPAKYQQRKLDRCWYQLIPSVALLACAAKEAAPAAFPWLRSIAAAQVTPEATIKFRPILFSPYLVVISVIVGFRFC